MTLLYFLFRQFHRPLIIGTLISGTSGVANTLLVMLISRYLTQPEPISTRVLTSFVVILLLALGTDLLAKWLLLNLTTATSQFLRINLAEQLLQRPYATIERIGAGRLQALLTEDVAAISISMGTLPSMTIALATIIGGICYLAWLSPTLFVGMASVALPAILGYRLLHRKALLQSKRMLQTRNLLFAHYRSLIDGVKELMLHQQRQNTFIDSLLRPAVQAHAKEQTWTRTWHLMAQSWNQSLYFFFILLLFAASSRWGTSVALMTTYAIVALYLKSSILLLLQNLSQWSEAEVAFRQVAALGFSFVPATTTTPISPIPKPSEIPIYLDFRNLEYRYAHEKAEQGFCLGPIDLTMQSGELLFIVGGNGSGKTTLIKLLVGLYIPQSGELRCNGELVSEQNLEQYRQNFSVIFADFFLFDQLLGIEEWQIGQRAEYYLKQLQIDHKVKINGNRLSTVNLSHGQRKRLALLTTYLEDRPVYVFDEWAASQDPEFREIFYRQLLPELKERGKLVIVISHDNTYFGVADRLIRLDFGKILEI